MKARLIATLIAIAALPLLIAACDQSAQSPTASNTSGQGNEQAMKPNPDDAMKNAPPAAGIPAEPPTPAPSAAPSPEEQPAQPAQPVPAPNSDNNGSSY